MDFESEDGKSVSNSLISKWSSFFEQKLNVLFGLLNNPEKRMALSKIPEMIGTKYTILT